MLLLRPTLVAVTTKGYGEKRLRAQGTGEPTGSDAELAPREHPNEGLHRFTEEEAEKLGRVYAIVLDALDAERTPLRNPRRTRPADRVRLAGASPGPAACPRYPVGQARERLAARGRKVWGHLPRARSRRHEEEDHHETQRRRGLGVGRRDGARLRGRRARGDRRAGRQAVP